MFLKLLLLLGVGGTCLRTLHTVLRTATAALVNTEGVKLAADNVVADTGEVTDTAATDQHDAVLLEVMALAADVCGDFLAIGQTDATDLAQRGIRLLGSTDGHQHSDATALRALLECTHTALRGLHGATFTDQLVDSRHSTGFLMLLYGDKKGVWSSAVA